MKVIIIEGPDCTGKNTIISHITELYETATIIHCQRPRTDDPNEQDRLFSRQVRDIINEKYSTQVLIFNRSFIGEYVYGVMYRNRNNIDTMNFINCLENLLNVYVDVDDLIYIQLLSTSAALLVQNDDSKSLSHGKIDKIQQEIDLFREIFDESHIVAKKLVFVNRGDAFRPLDDIVTEVINFIQEHER